MPDPRSKYGARRSTSRGFKTKSAEPKRRADLIGWSIFIVLLIGLVLICWMGTYYVFGHPEEPLSYSILKKMNKIEPPKRFEILQAPKGEFLTADKLLERYGKMSTRDLKNESNRLIRQYLKNYDNSQELVPYVTGRFNILDSYQLTDDDFIKSGVVAVAQDVDQPAVLIEHVFPAEERMIAALHRSLLTGLDIPIQRTQDLTAITGVEKLADGRLKFTVIPIHYPSYTASTGPGSFTLDPPTSVNVEAGLPILSQAKIADADARYSTYRRKAGLDTATAAGEPATSNELIRIQPATDLAGATPEPPPAPTPTPAPVAALASPPAPVPAIDPTIPVPPAVPLPANVTAALPTPAPTVAPAVPLKPFNPTSRPPAVANAAAGGWETYPAGQMPRGRLVGVQESASLAGQPVSGDRVYLEGDFVVTASGTNRAVLRSNAGAVGATTRVIVEYPAGSQPPTEGNRVSRGGERPFLITDVRETADGTVNISVREITR